MIIQFNNLLLIILLVLVIFCVGVYLYTDINVEKIINHDRFDNIADNKTLLLELMATAKQNANKILKEKFAIDERQILQNDAQNYYNSLNALQSLLDNTYNSEYGIMGRLRADIQIAMEARNIDKQAILSLLTNIYIINYMNSVNRQNAESYKMFLKYNDPSKNKYYRQYLK